MQIVVVVFKHVVFIAAFGCSLKSPSFSILVVARIADYTECIKKKKE